MPPDSHHLFLAYARADNRTGPVSDFAGSLTAAYRAATGRDLLIFFDADSLGGGDCWLILFLADRETGKIALDEKRRDSLGARLRIRVGEEEVKTGFGCVGYPELAAGNEEMIAMIRPHPAAIEAIEILLACGLLYMSSFLLSLAVTSKMISLVKSRSRYSGP